jgi:hypothetical protein
MVPASEAAQVLTLLQDPDGNVFELVDVRNKRMKPVTSPAMTTIALVQTYIRLFTFNIGIVRFCLRSRAPVSIQVSYIHSHTSI